MRIGALLFVSLGLVSVAACTATATKDEDCIVAGGICFTSLDLPGCTSIIEAQCSAGYTCCGMAYAANIVDGAVIDAPTGAPSLIDAGVSDGTAKDAAKEDAKNAEGGASRDAQADAPDASQRDAAEKDATLPADAGHGVDAAKPDADKGSDAGKADAPTDSGALKDGAVVG